LGCNLQESCRTGTGTTLTRAGNSVILNGVSGFTGADVGDSITITSASNSANRGTFPITGVGASTVTFTNTAGVSEGGTHGYSIGCRDPFCRRASGANFAGANGTTVDLTGGSGFTSADVNATITIRQAANAANLGNYRITQFLGATSVRLANPNGVNEGSN